METEPAEVFQFKSPTISYTNKRKGSKKNKNEGNKKTLLTQTLHRKTLKLLRKIKTFLPVGYKPRFTRETIEKLPCDDNLNAEIKWKEHIK